MIKHKKRFETIVNGETIKHSTNTKLCDFGWVLLKDGILCYKTVFYSKNKECAIRTASRETNNWNSTSVTEYKGEYSYKVFHLVDLNLVDK